MYVREIWSVFQKNEFVKNQINSKSCFYQIPTIFQCFLLFLSVAEFSKALLINGKWNVNCNHVIGKTKWILTKYETWFDFFLALFMREYKWDKWDLERSSFKANQVLHQLIIDVAGRVTLLGHLCPLINKAKKKSNQVSYLVSIHLIFPFSYGLFMSWINKTWKLDWCKTCRMLIVDIIELCEVTLCLAYSMLIP